MDRGRRILVHCAVAIAAAIGAWSLGHRPEPVRASRSSPSAAVEVTAAKREFVYLAGPGPVRAFFTAGIRSQAGGKPVVTWLSEAGRLVVNPRYAVRDRAVTVNEPAAAAVAKQSRSS